MAHAGLTLENPVTGERIVFRKTGEDRLVLDHFLKPHTGTFAEHVQLNQEERFTILRGKGVYLLDGIQRAAQAGERFRVPPGIPHRNPWNDSNAELVFRHETFPNLGSEIFFESIFSLAQAGKADRKGEVSALQVIVIGAGLQSQTYVTGLPITVQKALLPLLAAFGRRLGYPASYSMERSQ